MAKKTFNNPTKGTERKGLDLLINEPEDKKNENTGLVKDTYVTQNVQVRKDLMVKIHILKAMDSSTLSKTFDKVFEYYFKNNPI